MAISYGLLITVLGVAGVAGMAGLGTGMDAAIGGASSAAAVAVSTESATAAVLSSDAARGDSPDFFAASQGATTASQVIATGGPSNAEANHFGPVPRYVGGTLDGAWDALWDLGKGTLGALKSVAWDFAAKDIAWGTASGLAGVVCKVVTLGDGCQESSWNPIKRTSDSVWTFIKGVPNVRHVIGDAAHQASLCLNPWNGQAAQDRGHACGATLVAVGDVVLGAKGAGKALKGITAAVRGGRAAEVVGAAEGASLADGARAGRLADDVTAVHTVRAVATVRPALNDSVLVARTDGSFSVARVAAIFDDGVVRVEFPLGDGSRAAKFVPADELRTLSSADDAALGIARRAVENDDLARYADQLRRAGDSPAAIEKFVAAERDFYAFSRDYANPNAGFGERRLVVGGGRGADTPHLRPNDVGVDAILYGDATDLRRLGEVRPDVVGSIHDAPFANASFAELHFERVEPSAFLDHNARGLRESRRVLKSGGAITIQTGSIVSTEALANALRVHGFVDIKVGRLPDGRVVAAARAAGSLGPR